MDPTTLTQNVERLRGAYRSGRTLPVAWRRSQLQAMQRLVKEGYAEFEAALQADLHKSAFECYATEIGFLAHEVDYALDHLDAWVRPQKTRTPVFLLPASSRIVYEPLGVALIMGAWNYPLQLTLGPLVAAIAAGNAAVLKAPRTAPATFKAIARLIPQYLDPEAFLVVDEDTPNELLLDQRWDKIFFTGGAEVGKIVMQAAARQLTPVTLELGGKSPALVDETADLEVAARRIVQGKFFNAGQTCVAPDYVLVQQSVHDRLLAALVEALRRFYSDDPRTSPEYARIIHQRHFDTLAAYLADGEIVCGGQAVREERYLAPTILKNVSPDAPVMQTEIFGPVLPVLPVRDMDAALQFVAQREKPLAFYIFSRDRAVIDHVLAASTSGGVCVNDTLNHLVVPGLPFGGVGASGMGKYHGEWGFREFSNARAILDQSTRFDPDLRYPPYSGGKLERMRKLMTLRLPAVLDAPLGWLLEHAGEGLLRLVR